MTGFHPVQRRLVEMHQTIEKKGGIKNLSTSELTELEQCLKVNASIIYEYDRLTNLLDMALICDDEGWQTELDMKLLEFENKLS